MKLSELARLASMLDVSLFTKEFPDPVLVFPVALAAALDNALATGSAGPRVDETQELKTTTRLNLKDERPAPDEPEGLGRGAVVVSLKKRSPWTPFNDVLTVGRATIQDVCIALPSVSKFHACITLSPEGWRITDERAANGTFVNGRKLVPGGSARLEEGTKLGFGPEAEAQFFTAKGLHARLIAQASPRTA